jgi:hypothetical protein
MSQQSYLRVRCQVHRKVAYPAAPPALPKISSFHHGLLGVLHDPELALRFHPKMLVYVAAAEAPRDCPLPVQQSDDAARLQLSRPVTTQASWP